MSPPDWYVSTVPGGDVQLFAFPFAGGGCAQFADFARVAARRGVEVLAANLPGRQARLGEPARTRFAPLAAELAEALAGALDGRPYLMLGTCSGSLLALGVLRQLTGRSLPLPERLFVVSYDAPDIAVRPRRMPGFSSESLWTALGQWGGVPPGLATSDRLRRVAEPAIRADLAVLASYRHEAGAPLPVPITVCYGHDDPDAIRGALLGWRRQTAAGLELCGLDGGHWLLDDAPEALADALVRHRTAHEENT